VRRNYSSVDPLLIGQIALNNQNAQCDQQVDLATENLLSPTKYVPTGFVQAELI